MGLTGDSRVGRAWTHRTPSTSLEEPHRRLDLWAWPSPPALSSLLGEPEASCWSRRRFWKQCPPSLSLRAPASHSTRDGLPGKPSVTLLRLISPVLESSKFCFVLGRVQVSPVSVAVAEPCVSTPEMLCALPARSTGHPCPAAQLGRRPGPGPCQPPGSAHGCQSGKLTAGEESRGLGPGDRRPGVTGELGVSRPPKYREPHRHRVGGRLGLSVCTVTPPSFPAAQRLLAGGAGENPRGYSLG